jgi:hypothetical protein
VSRISTPSNHLMSIPATKRLSKYCSGPQGDHQTTDPAEEHANKEPGRKSFYLVKASSFRA